MNQVVVYKNDKGGVSVIYPTEEALSLYGIRGIASRDVPDGKPFRIISASDLPADRAFRNAWEYVE